VKAPVDELAQRRGNASPALHGVSVDFREPELSENASGFDRFIFEVKGGLGFDLIKHELSLSDEVTGYQELGS